MTRQSDLASLTIPMRSGLITAGVAFAIYLVTSYIVADVLLAAGKELYGEYPSRVPGHPLLMTASLAGMLAAGSFAYVRLRRFGWRAVRRPTAHDVAVYAIAVAAVVLLYVTFDVVSVIWHIRDPFNVMRNFSVRDPNPAVTVAGIVSTYVGACITAPFWEEAEFRALVFGALITRYAPLRAAIISAILFGTVHADPIAFPVLGTYGFIACMSYALTRNLLVPIALHATTNVVLISLLIAHPPATPR